MACSMTCRSTDHELLARYVRQSDHDAFAQIVQRYIGLVRSAAMRQTRDPALADDVTQAVMIVLARRGRTIPRSVSLASWLFTVTHHISRTAQRSRARRAVHERRAASERQGDHSSSSRVEPDLLELLDEAITTLPHLERGGVVLYYLNECSHQQVGEALGLSPEAARKRVSRGLQRLREHLVEQGIAVSAGLIASTMKSDALCAMGTPIESQVVKTAVSVALLCASDAPVNGGMASAILAQGVPAIHSVAKWKLAASIALLAAG